MLPFVSVNLDGFGDYTIKFPRLPSPYMYTLVIQEMEYDTAKGPPRNAYNAVPGLKKDGQAYKYKMQMSPSNELTINRLGIHRTIISTLRDISIVKDKSNRLFATFVKYNGREMSACLHAVVHTTGEHKDVALPAGIDDVFAGIQKALANKMSDRWPKEAKYMDILMAFTRPAMARHAGDKRPMNTIIDNFYVGIIESYGQGLFTYADTALEKFYETAASCSRTEVILYTYGPNADKLSVSFKMGAQPPIVHVFDLLDGCKSSILPGLPFLIPRDI